jgi:translation initiation factor eIF-2B subunit delta
MGILNSLKSDNVRGATEIALEAAALLEDAASAGRMQAGELREAAGDLAAAQGSMAPVLRLAREVARCATANEVARACRDFRARTLAAAPMVAAHAAVLIEDGAVVMTHSASRAVRDALVGAQARGRKFEVIATESRPRCEGVGLAGALAAAGIKVTLIVDALAAGEVRTRATMAMTGADAVTPYGVRNKAGTYALALAARRAGRPFYVVCDSGKFWGEALAAERVKPGGEVLETVVPGGVEVRNMYFDETPLELVTGVVTESGVLEPRVSLLFDLEVARQAEETQTWRSAPRD